MKLPGEYLNFGHLFLNTTIKSANYRVLEWKHNENYTGFSGEDLKHKVFLCSKALDEHGLLPDDKAIILSENRWEWAVADFGCIFNKIITVPVYTSMTSEQIKYIIQHSEAKIAFISNEVQLDKLLAIRNDLPDFKFIIKFSDTPVKNENVKIFSDFLGSSDNTEGIFFHNRKEKKIDEFLKEKADRINPNDVLTIIYTSGTTGIPKGVCLTHKNILSNLDSCHEAFRIDETDVFLSYLPLAHTYERTAGYYLPISARSKIVYAMSIDTISSQLPEVNPTVMTSVPILFSRIYNKLIKTADKMRGVKKAIFKKGIDTADKYDKDNMMWKIYDKLVYKKIREKLGSRIRFFISGGSAMNAEIGRKFDAFGIKVLEGYGMTEAAPVISVNREDNNEFGTVGLPLKNVQVKLADDGEILVKGDNVMPGYYKNKEETEKTIIDGWLHTGDIGEITDKGFLRITDRKKMLYKTAGGKYISLTHIEDVLSSSPFISQVFATGGDKMFVSALIIPEFDELIEFANKEGIKYSTNEELINNEKIKGLLEKAISEQQKNLAKHEKVRRYKLIPKPFTIESGELTPTLKMKRKNIEDNYKELIDDMYDLKKRA